MLFFLEPKPLEWLSKKNLKILHQTLVKKYDILVVRPNNLRVRAESQARFTSQDVYKKLKKFAELRSIPIVTEEWINLCYEYTYKFSY